MNRFNLFNGFENLGLKLLSCIKTCLDPDYFYTPALVITHGDKVHFTEGEVIIVDVDDFDNPKQYSILNTYTFGKYAYDVPTVLTKFELLLNRYKLGS